MKLTSWVVGAVAIAVLSGCGGSDGPSASKDQPKGQNSSRGGEISGEVSDGTSASAETAAKQLAKRFEASGFAVDGSTMTFTMASAKPDESKLISNCQISTAVISGVAAGEINSIVLKYSDAELTCAELLK